MRKGLKVCLIIFLVLVVFFIVVSTVSVKGDYFSLDINFDNEEYQKGEIAIIKVKLKNNSLGFYKATFLSTPIMIFIYEEGENHPSVPTLAIERYIIPFGRFNNETTLKIDMDKVYIIHGFSNCTIRGEKYIIEEKFKIEYGKVTHTI